MGQKLRCALGRQRNLFEAITCTFEKISPHSLLKPPLFVEMTMRGYTEITYLKYHIHPTVVVTRRRLVEVSVTNRVNVVTQSVSFV